MKLIKNLISAKLDYAIHSRGFISGCDVEIWSFIKVPVTELTYNNVAHQVYLKELEEFYSLW